MTTPGADAPQDPQVGENVCPDCAGEGCDTCGGTGTVQEVVGDA